MPHGPSGTKHLDRVFAVLSPVIDFISLPSYRLPNTTFVSSMCFHSTIRLVMLSSQLPANRLAISQCPFLASQNVSTRSGRLIDLTQTCTKNTIKRAAQTYALCFRKSLCVRYVTQPRTLPFALTLCLSISLSCYHFLTTNQLLF
jgi:hypothetical protein